MTSQHHSDKATHGPASVRKDDSASRAVSSRAEPAVASTAGGARFGGTRLRGWLLLAVGFVVGVGALVAALRIGRAIDVQQFPGIPSAGPLTIWGLPVIRALGEATAMAAVGLSVTAAFFVPTDNRAVSALGYRLLGRAAWCALIWSLSTVALLVFTLSDVLGQPLAAVGSPRMVLHFATSVGQGQALGVEAVLALVVAVGCRLTLSRDVAALLAIVAVVGVLPPALSGHSAAAGNHQLAVTSLLFHIGGASLWVGGLIALFMVRNATVLASVAARYSRMALGCFVVVAVSGIGNAWVRLGEVGQLWSSHYGWLVLAKSVALVALGCVGVAHRTRTLPMLHSGRPRGFRRFAAGEVLVFAATVGLAVALSRSPTPVPRNPTPTDTATDIVGFSMPGAPTAGRMLGDVLPDLFFVSVVVVGLWAYLAGVWRLRRAGHRWPVGRTLSWICGLLILGAVTNLGVARYAYILFSVHMTQHMVLSMLVPILLVLGAPATLALRAVRPSPDPAVRGPREWLLLFLHSRYMRVMSHPIVAGALFVSSLYGLYFSSLFETAMRYHLGHLLMLTHFVLVGYLFFWVVIGIDPGRRNLPHPVLMLVHFGAMIFHAFFGVALMQSTQVIASSWFTPLHPAWGASLLSDQGLGAGITWAFGEVPSAIVFAALIVQWIRQDEREQRRLDRAADRAEAKERARVSALTAVPAQSNVFASVGAGSSNESASYASHVESGGEESDEPDPDDAHAQYNAFLRGLHDRDQGQA